MLMKLTTPSPLILQEGEGFGAVTLQVFLMSAWKQPFWHYLYSLGLQHFWESLPRSVSCLSNVEFSAAHPCHAAQQENVRKIVRTWSQGPDLRAWLYSKYLTIWCLAFFISAMGLNTTCLIRALQELFKLMPGRILWVSQMEAWYIRAQSVTRSMSICYSWNKSQSTHHRLKDRSALETQEPSHLEVKISKRTQQY